MLIDDFDFETSVEEETASEAEETEEAEEETKEEKPKQEKPKVDHSIPVRERIIQERDKLKFESVVMGSMQRQAAKIIGDMVLAEFDNFPEREGEWDYNEWTLVDFLKAFGEEARKAVQGNGDQAMFAGRTEDPNDPTMEVIRGIIHRKNEKPKPAPTPKAESKPAPKKEKPQKEPSRIMNLFEDFND